MKILHTSDWHLGHTLYSESQEDAHKHMLSQIKTVVGDKKPDVLIVSGDIYDTTQPSANIQQMFADAIVEIHEACPSMTIVCIAGNHDSGSKHMIFHTPWKALNVHMVGNILKESDLNDYIIPIENKGYVVAVPFAADRFMPDNVFKVLSEMVNERNANNLPVVLTAHLAISKADWRGHDFSSDTNIGGLNCQELEVFGNGYDYIALGHIHRQQKLDKEGHIWYSGTPIAVSFDESYPGNDHGLLMVECKAHGEETKVEPIPIENLHPLVNLPIEGFANWETAKKAFGEYDNNIDSFVRLNVEVDDYLPTGANDEILNMKKEMNKKCRVCVINSKRKTDISHSSSSRTMTTTELKQIDFMDVAKMYLEAQNIEFDDEIKQMLNEIKEMLNTNDNIEA